MNRLLVVCLLVALILPGIEPTPAAAQSGPALELFQEVNAYRAAHGQPPFEANSSLMIAAQRHADWMAATHTYSHQGEGGTMPQDRAAAAGYQGFVYENVAGGTLGWATIQWAVMGWDSSPGHRQTMLSNNVHAGTGVANNADDTLFVLVVGSPSRFAQAPAGGQPQTTGGQEEVEPVLVVVPIVIATPDETGSVWHVVQQGQTAWALAARYEVSLDDLLALNGLDRESILKPGDRVLIRVGEGQTSPPTPTPPVTHVAQEGETIWDIAMRYGTTVDALLALNGLERGAILLPGDVVLLRTPDPTATPTVPPTPTSPPTLTPDASPTPSPAAGTAIAAVLPSPTVTATLTPTVSPTPVPAPVRPKDTGESDQTWITVIVIAWFGLALVVGGAAVVSLRRKR
ncbi:MAG: LysM peptidoglycan-binding domain-containing protein [Anaerolineae bacterium]|nr:LysM peptidoglycan-binding domain-containing protein [Anaerolineae bacterium]